MPHERIPLTRSDRPGAFPEAPIDARALPARMRWAAASADFLEGLGRGGAVDPLTLLAGLLATAADADLACVVQAPAVPARGGGPGCADSLVVHAAHGRSGPPPVGLAFPAAGSLCGRVLATGRPVLADGGDRESAGPESQIMAGPTLVVPLAGPGTSARPALALTASRFRGAPPFTAADLESAAGFARLAQAGLRLERSGADRARLAVLSDRERIAHDLHDRVIQRLFATGLAVQALGGRITDPALGRRLTDQVGALDAVIAEIRTAIFGFAVQAHADPPSARRRILDLLDELGPLLPHPPRVVFSGALDLLVTAALADDLVAVVREGLTNVVRHARTRDTEVNVSAGPGTLTIRISDDGVGLGGCVRRSGLANLSARAERWQGTVSLTDRAPHGARLSWTARLAGGPGQAAR